MKKTCILFLFSLFLFLPGKSSAFQRSKTNLGVELYWENPSISYYIHNFVPKELSKAKTHDEIQKSFAPWTTNQTNCSCVSFQYKGITTDKSGYDKNNPENDKNIVFFYTSGWPHERGAVAVTSTVFQEDTGEIVAFDMDINADIYDFSVEDVPSKPNTPT